MTRNHLALISGFLRVSEATPYGTRHAGYAISQSIARIKAFKNISAYSDNAAALRRGERQGAAHFEPPPNVQIPLHDKSGLVLAGGEYAAVYALAGEVGDYLPQAIRPLEDWVPVVSEVDISHDVGQWTQYFIGAHTGRFRPTDAFIFKSKASERVFREVWADWETHTGRTLPAPQTFASLNGVDAESNSFDAALRARTRRWLGIADDAVVFLAFSRLEPYFKGDPEALVALWQHVVRAVPQATLLLSGALPVDATDFAEKLQAAARRYDVAHRVVVLADPFNYFSNARNALMSAADVFVHLTTGVQEACPLVILEAMAHGLPPIASRWSGIPEVVTHNRTGWLIDTYASTAPSMLTQTIMGRHELYWNKEAARAASIDAVTFVRTAIAVAQNEALRKSVGGAARNTAKHDFSWDDKARERMSFVKQLAEQAEKDWQTAPLPHGVPLANINTVLRALSGATLTAGHQLRLSSAESLPPLLARASGMKAAMQQAIVDALGEAAGSVTALDVARAIRIPNTDRADDDAAWSSNACHLYQQVLMELVSYGVVAVDSPATATSTSGANPAPTL